MSFSKNRIKRAESLTERNPTEEQKISGSYQKGKVNLKGFTIAIENPQFSIRSGIDEYGNKWSNSMKFTYGYFVDTVGADGDEIDVFIGPNVDNNFDVYVIDQVVESTRQFDEHKVMFGFESQQSAVKAYLTNYQRGWTGFENITQLSLSEFGNWLRDSQRTKIPIKQKQIPTMNYLNAEQGSDKINIVELKGEVIVDETLKNLINQTKDIKSDETLVLEIASPGGSVEEGLKIMLWLESLSKQGVQIITVVTANAYSIASLIMLAADIKLISRYGKVMVHNPMVPELSYVNANELEKHINSLRELEGYMYSLYQRFTGLDIDDIKLLMDNETYLSPSDAVQKGFADMVVNIKETPYEMASKQEKTVNMTSTVNMLKQVIAKVNGAGICNQLYYDNEGGEIEIYQADPSQYQVGDKASVENGEVQLADGCKLIIKGGVIEDIMPAEIVQPAVEEPVITEGEIAPSVDQTASTEELMAPSVEVEQVVEPMSAEFNTGPTPEETAMKPKDAMPSSTIEKTESTVTTKETVAQAEPMEKPMAVVEEPVAQADEVIEAFASPQVESMAPQKEMVSMDEFKALQSKVVEMAAKMEYQEKEMKARVEASNNFQSTAAEAIETLAKNTVSGFTPEAKVKAKQEFNFGRNSIFQKAKKKAGLAK